MTRVLIPIFAADFPEVADTINRARLPFYCANCYCKRETVWLTPNFGPFCDECLKAAEKVALVLALTKQGVT